ncbi:MAG: IS30 family transposase [Nitrospiraceae bacterium]
MRYHQLTSEERYALSALRKQGCSQSQIARSLGRHRSTISRELRRNARQKPHWYRPFNADEMTRGRRRRSRRNLRFTETDLKLVRSRLALLWSPEQIAGRLREEGLLRISHETIYRYVWSDWLRGGSLHLYLRGARKQRRKRYRSYDSRGRLGGKRHISERPAGAEKRSRIGHLEGDTMIGAADKHCILTLVDRKTGYTFIGKLAERTVQAANQRAISIIKKAGRSVKTLTLDNGTEFHGYKDIEASTGATIYFATPHHSWERGTNENTNGLIRQYLPKRKSMAHTTQKHCDRIAEQLNSRPRKRLAYLTPKEVYEKESNK